ncbi:TRAF-interacting protein with FHA domain-containing protein A [Anolis carolinensis]|uniref:TRAF-interacting protein with FHA domain-containing protein A n=1 Tax=Anolis carolinensis TaxID=28377 RepID=UPI0001F9DBE2|nr:PREDICTED: TRAF-interacting protein with FHA domain-containing protein A [Anolis carolinensis]|eukprot:XP_008110303.1 PREDICTED: TRAF-interacting protein with FHA domain-containing protein A [Anolis carolinensis]
MATAFETADTEETTTSLNITVYHPEQEKKQVFRAIRFCQREQLRVDELVKFGRNCDICRFYFVDSHVSRIQFALQLFRPFGSSELVFEIMNLSKRVKLIVDSVELAFLNKFIIPQRCLVRFGDYQLLMEKQDGQSENFFEISFDMSKTSLWQEAVSLSVPETGVAYSPSPEEMDEDE